MVARLLWEQDVAGSNPVIPTKKEKITLVVVFSFFAQFPVFDVCVPQTESCLLRVFFSLLPFRSLSMSTLFSALRNIRFAYAFRPKRALRALFLALKALFFLLATCLSKLQNSPFFFALCIVSRRTKGRLKKNRMIYEVFPFLKKQMTAITVTATL